MYFLYIYICSFALPRAAELYLRDYHIWSRCSYCGIQNEKGHSVKYYFIKINIFNEHDYFLFYFYDFINDFHLQQTKCTSFPIGVLFHLQPCSLTSFRMSPEGHILLHLLQLLLLNIPTLQTSCLNRFVMLDVGTHGTKYLFTAGIHPGLPPCHQFKYNKCYRVNCYITISVSF